MILKRQIKDQSKVSQIQMASKGNMSGVSRGGSQGGNVDFLKNLKLENKTRAFSTAKNSFIKGDSIDSKDNSDRPGSNQDYADHLIEHNEQWNQKKVMQF